MFKRNMTRKLAAFRDLLAIESKINRSGVTDARNFHNNLPLNKEWGAVIENN